MPDIHSFLPAGFPLTSPAHVRPLLRPLPLVYGVPADMLHLEQIHPLLSGNKAFKLKGHLQRFADSGRRCLLSFGGPYSNHLHALAACGHLTGIPVVLVVRGYASVPLTPTLQDCSGWGAQLVFVDKHQYARRYDAGWQAQLACEFDALVIPEGGSGADGEWGCRDLAPLCAEYDEVWLAVGSGATAKGIAAGLAAGKNRCRLVGVNAVADQGERLREWQQSMPAGVDWRLLDNAHCGGFARTDEALLQLIRRWDNNGLLLDPVYTGKMMLAFERALAGGELTDRRVLLLHSGGLQGRRGVKALSADGRECLQPATDPA